MTTEVTKTTYDGQKFTELGSYSSLESAHGEHSHYEHQQTFEDIEASKKAIKYFMQSKEVLHIDDKYKYGVGFTMEMLFSSKIKNYLSIKSIKWFVTISPHIDNKIYVFIYCSPVE
jgi:hypothetical protein